MSSHECYKMDSTQESCIPIKVLLMWGTMFSEVSTSWIVYKFSSESQASYLPYTVYLVCVARSLILSQTSRPNHAYVSHLWFFGSTTGKRYLQHYVFLKLTVCNFYWRSIPDHFENTNFRNDSCLIATLQHHYYNRYVYKFSSRQHMLRIWLLNFWKFEKFIQILIK